MIAVTSGLGENAHLAENKSFLKHPRHDFEVKWFTQHLCLTMNNGALGSTTDSLNPNKLGYDPISPLNPGTDSTPSSSGAASLPGFNSPSSYSGAASMAAAMFYQQQQAAAAAAGFDAAAAAAAAVAGGSANPVAGHHQPLSSGDTPRYPWMSITGNQLKSTFKGK